MRFSFGQELRQEQKQILSQRMIQSMEILQLTVQQLEERIEQELESNPMLELDDTPPDIDVGIDNDVGVDSEQYDESYREISESSGDEAVDSVLPDTNENVTDSVASDAIAEVAATIADGEMFTAPQDGEKEFSTADEFSSLYPDTIDEAPARSQSSLEEASERHEDMMASIPSRSQTLSEYLIDQLVWYDPSEEVRAMAERIIFSLDRNGFFTESLDEFLGSQHTADDLALANKALQLVQRLEPVGIASADVRECLLTQLTPDLPYYDLLAVLISEHLENMEYNRLPLISRKTGYTLTDIQEAIVVLRRLNPFPAAGFSNEAAPPIVPDVILEKTKDGNYEIFIENGRFHALRVSPEYKEMVKKKSVDKEARDYIRRNSNSAQWLIDSIAQRQNTLLRVTQAIVDYQRDFFDIGPEAIKPLKMQQIADAVGVHVTTISRTCDEKWMLTPHGMVQLRKFFTSSMPSSEEESGEVAQEAVKSRLKEIVDNEDKTAPLSDDDIVKLMNEAGVKIARRTVVKYRQSMGITNSRQRRTW
ncbi:MAG: RNA polymerase factor sigma-54 [Planctomycetaceae bacterium]|jgi:RNA polymerase sigma-54 factor|nr:RNA polymerase factor sigma-54 [Planctomycetaceae bacterium]